MDPRVPHVKRPNGQVVALGKVYPDLDAAEKGVAEIIAQREKIAQRPLSGKELRDGPILPDPRSERERLFDAQWRPKMARTKPTDDNPFRSAIEDDEDVPVREQLRRKAEKAWDEKKEKQRDRTSPQRLAAIAEAEQILEQMRFEPGVTQGEIERAARLVEQAKVGDLGHYRQMKSAITDLRVEKYSDQAAKTQAAIAQNQAELAAMQQRMTELRPAEPEQQTPVAGLTYLRVDYSQAAGGGSTIIEYQNGERTGRQFDPSTCDQSIIEQAE